MLLFLVLLLLMLLNDVFDVIINVGGVDVKNVSVVQLTLNITSNSLSSKWQTGRLRSYSSCFCYCNHSDYYYYCYYYYRRRCCCCCYCRRYLWCFFLLSSSLYWCCCRHFLSFIILKYLFLQFWFFLISEFENKVFHIFFTCKDGLSYISTVVNSVKHSLKTKKNTRVSISKLVNPSETHKLIICFK